MLRSYKYRLFTTSAQEVALTDMLGDFCELYNCALQHRIQAYAKGVSVRYYDQTGQLPEIRRDLAHQGRWSATAQKNVLRRLDKAFAAFFGRVKRGGKAGFPRYRAKARFDSANFCVGDGLTIRKSKRIGIKGIPGEIKVRLHRDLPVGAKVSAAVISRSCGKWYVCFQITLANAEPIERDFAPIGIDLGLTSLVALSNGETVPTPQHTRLASKRHRRLARALSRCKRDSRRRGKAKARLARHNAKTANQRRDFSHKLSRTLVDRFSHIAFEELNIKGLAAGMLAKAVHNAAWRQLIQQTTYKAESAGGFTEGVRPRGTTIDCSGCGEPVPKTLRDRMHVCPACGLVLCRDHNAALNVLARSSFGAGTALRPTSQRVAA